MNGGGDVLVFTEDGIHCPAGGFHIDPWRPVARAVITHAHADHARPGHGAYLATGATAAMLRHRLGDVTIQVVEYGDCLRIGSADVSLHPAGHVPGSAQVRVGTEAGTWVVSGDYKLADDGLSAPFEPVRCDAFVTECTFGLPVFRWQTQDLIAAEIDAWWAASAAAGRIPVLAAYSLGKAQRILSMLDPARGPILCHAAIEASNEVLRAQGISLPDTIPATGDTGARTHPGAIVIAPPSALGSAWTRRFAPLSTGFASGWMALRGVRRRRGADRGFVISDHADWAGLNDAIDATGAERVFVTHGYTDVFRAWLESRGYDAAIVATRFSGEDAEPAAADAEAPTANGDAG